MSPTMYFLIDEIFVSWAPGHLRGRFLFFYYCHVVEKSEVRYTTYGDGHFGGKTFYPYISNVPVQSAPAQRLAWRQHITVTTLIIPRINNVKKTVA